jgi:hypothetical protein
MKPNMLSQNSKNGGGKGREEIGRSFPFGYLVCLKGIQEKVNDLWGP